MNNHRHHYRSRQGAGAQSMVEFALALPVFLLLVLGVLEAGRLLFIYSAVFTASREASRYGSVVGNSPNGMPFFQDCVGIRDSAMRIGSIAGIPNDSAHIQISYDNPDITGHDEPACPPSNNVGLGDRIIVNVNVDYEPMLGLTNLPSFNISSTSRRTIVRNLDLPGSGVTYPTPLPALTETPNLTATAYMLAQTAMAQTATASSLQTATSAASTATAVHQGTLTATALTETAIFENTSTASALTATVMAGYTRTPTPTATLTPTRTLTPTTTHTPEPTFTPTPTLPPCPIGGLFPVERLKKDITIPVSNYAAGADAITISSVDITWPSAATHSLQVVEVQRLLAIDTIWTGNATSYYTTIPTIADPWIGSTSARMIDTNEMVNLVFRFSDDVLYLEPSAYTVKVTFSNRCEVSWQGTYGSGG